VLASLLGGGRLGADEVAEREPGPEARGPVFRWTSPGGVACEYRIPEGYDPERGAALTVILHGSNLDRRWGFANHAAKSFRPADLVVSPDGTTPNGAGGFNSLGRPEDARRFRDFLQAWKSRFRVTATYLYGHSQGSFFALYFAGEHPEEVDGVVAHASGVWTQTRLGKKGHHQAIVLLHGTEDPVVPYVQSVGGLAVLQEAKYPLVRLRSLEGWNHWPAEHNGPVPHTSQQLAWVEGMTTTNPERLAACWEVLGEAREPREHDYAATYLLARRLERLGEAPARLRQSAAAAARAVEALVEAHARAMALPRSLTLGDPEKGVATLGRRLSADGTGVCA
jgi:predicted esterase